MLRQILVGTYQSFELYSIFNIPRRRQACLATFSEESCSQISALGQESWIQYLTLLFIQRGPLLLEMELALVDVIWWKTDTEHRCRNHTDLGINVSLQLERIADSL